MNYELEIAMAVFFSLFVLFALPKKSSNKWIETKIANGKITHENFIAQNRSGFTFAEAKDGEFICKQGITEEEAEKLIKEHNLEAVKCDLFRHSVTWRTAKSNAAIEKLERKRKAGRLMDLMSRKQ